VNVTTCAEGYYCAYPGLQIRCGSGTKCPSGSASPTFCDGGILCDGSGVKIDCQPSYFCPPGATQATKCTGTTWSERKASSCSSCPGKYKLHDFTNSRFRNSFQRYLMYILL